MQTQNTSKPGRIESIDAMRGWVMFMLISSGFGTRALLDQPFWGDIGILFTHHPWHGLRPWDLVMPLFMFVAGVSMPFAFAKRAALGQSRGQMLGHVLRRSATLLVLGVFLVSVHGKAPVFNMINVLSQLSVAYLLAYLLMRRSLRYQVLATLVILLVYDLAYRFFPYAQFFPEATSPWDLNQNLGAYVEVMFLGSVPAEGWLSLNFISLAAHTVWGVCAGLLLKSDRLPGQKLRYFLVSGAILLIVGLLLAYVTPINKRIATSTYVLHTGGWCLLIMAFFYWFVDLKKQGGKIHFLTIVGMNSIFIYMVGQLLGGWSSSIIGIFDAPILENTGTFGVLLHHNLKVLWFWYLCWWLYKRKIFIKI
jgi:predicted acyltransferase